MTRTIAIEELPADTQRILQDLLTPGASVILSQGGQPFGEMAAYQTPLQNYDENFEPETPEEIADILEAVRQGRADCAAGRCIPFEEVKARLAARLMESEK